VDSFKFHPGEREIQRRGGVQKMADKVGRMIHDAIPGAAVDFLEEQRMLVVGYRDDSGRVRASLLTGRPGFARALDPKTLRVDGPSPPPGEAAVLAIDFDHRSRMRLNGTLDPVPGGFRIRAREVYSNCPKYIQRRTIAEERETRPAQGQVSPTLTASQRELITSADTFFIATVPPGLHADVSHRGGNPGFVRVSDGRLSWDDYQGNTMFNTLGNLHLDPETALLFVDFQDGRLLHLNGQARTIGDKERTIDFEIREIVDTPGGHPFRWTTPVYSPFNPR
jgi:predicted pyridoxine 5'-phosphate oxidase superfamily flavin-nucleotide-binding protein